MLPSSRASFDFAMARDGAKSKCDLILDLSGRTRLFSDKRRDGYLHVDPHNPAAVARAMFEVSDLVGEFEKPRYVAYDAGICAHAQPQGRLQLPRGLPDGRDHARRRPRRDRSGDLRRLRQLRRRLPDRRGELRLPAPRGRDRPCRHSALGLPRRGRHASILLAHDEKHGGELISAMALRSRTASKRAASLVLSVPQLGHDLFAAMLALGAEQIVVLAPPDEPPSSPRSGRRRGA